MLKCGPQHINRQILRASTLVNKRHDLLRKFCEMLIPRTNVRLGKAAAKLCLFTSLVVGFSLLADGMREISMRD